MIASEENSESQATSQAIVEEGWPVRVLKSTTLRGCNVYHDSTVIRQRVDLGRLAGLYTGAAGPNFAGRFIDRFLGLETITAEGHITEDFLERLTGARGVRLEEALFEAILAVEMSMACVMHRLETLEFAEIVRDGSQRVMDFVWECHVPSISRVSARVGLAGVVELLPHTLYPRRTKSGEGFATRLAALRKRAIRRQWSTRTAVLALAAKRRGLPCEPIGGAYLRLGNGIAQHVIYAPSTAGTSFTASQVARNEWMAKRRRKTVGLTVPFQNEAATIEDTSATIGLDVAGVGLVTPDTKELHEYVDGRIVEMNAPPGFRKRTLPPYDEPRDDGAVLDRVVPPGTSERIPVALIAGERGTVSVARDLDAILRVSGKAVGLATQKGSSVCGKPVEAGSLRPWDTARFLLHDPRVETLVSTASPRRVVQRGLRLDACDVTAIMNPAFDGDIRSFRRTVEVLVRATAGILVVGTGNTLARDAMDSLEPRRIILLSGRLPDRSINPHLAAGGAAVLRAKKRGHEYIELHRAGETVASIPISSIRARRGEMSDRRIQARMFAMALAFGLGLSGQEIESAATLRTQ